ncbi:NUDIX domain-containing protein [Mucilaginibacter robiniae]|uniref:NUDIX domain-containing protein n=1 Tax=Mucilaginibacter robiniae TaxID=2728022 RepID=A0A7L5E6J7_9SPHI|nr:NUDIX domain-containing protein [Mucilaginibacter robiniae]QJD97969.1 NUDIX domain-containing protein [Mucilaginibacter robiniae]
MPRQSAGILLYRKINQDLEVFLVHPGGPYFANKDVGAWTIPKGEFTDDEEALTAAQREFKEETGQTVEGNFIQLQSIKQKGGKIVHAWAVEGNIAHEAIISNTFKMEYPYKSGKWISVPEVDKGAWFTADEARSRINPAQSAFIDELVLIIHNNNSPING